MHRAWTPSRITLKIYVIVRWTSSSTDVLPSPMAARPVKDQDLPSSSSSADNQVQLHPVCTFLRALRTLRWMETPFYICLCNRIEIFFILFSLLTVNSNSDSDPSLLACISCLSMRSCPYFVLFPVGVGDVYILLISRYRLFVTLKPEWNAIKKKKKVGLYCYRFMRLKFYRCLPRSMNDRTWNCSRPGTTENNQRLSAQVHAEIIHSECIWLLPFPINNATLK